MSSKKKPADFKKKQGPKTIATASSWGKKRAAATPLDLPSGNTVLVKNVDLPTLLASGAFPDSLMAIVSEKIESATGKSDTPKQVDPEAVKSVMGDPAKLAQLFEAIDRIVPLVVQEPVVFHHKQFVRDQYGAETTELETIPDEQRIDDVVYTDQVDLEDKMFIFQFTVGGTREVEDFREELASVVADVPAG